MTEKKDPWEGYDPDAPRKEPPPPEEIVKMLEKRIDLLKTQRGVPGWMLALQAAAIIYIVVNTWFLYANITNRAAGYIAAYMLPLTVLLFFFIYAIGELKKIARDEKK